MTSRVRRAAGTVLSMTESLDRPQASDSHDAVIAEALAVIDQALGRVSNRDVVSSVEVADLLLDVRTLLTAVPAESV
jgi:hypothetical protein